LGVTYQRSGIAYQQLGVSRQRQELTASGRHYPALRDPIPTALTGPHVIVERLASALNAFPHRRHQ